SASGAQVAEVAADAWPGVGRTVAIHRDVLHDILVEGARGADLRLGVTFEGIDDRDERVGVTFSDESFREYDLVVGADGARSAARPPCAVTRPCAPPRPDVLTSRYRRADRGP